MKFKPEFLPLTVNLISFGYYLFHGGEPGKSVYWLGATILTIGLLLMKG